MHMVTAKTELKKIYADLRNKKVSCGKFHKACLHLHTPASYDYKLLNSWNSNDYHNATDEDLLEKCKAKNIIIDSVCIDDIRNEINSLPSQPFSNPKEFLAYYLMAFEIIKQKYELILVTDHHTTEGANKLREVLKYVHRNIRPLYPFPSIITGIEISCADKNHVVCIIDTAENIAAVNKWVEENVDHTSSTSIRSSLEVLELLNRMNLFGYIAHVDSSDTFKSASVTSGAYKTALINRSHVFGLSSISHKDLVKSQIRSLSKKNVNFILDNDAHCLEEISKNPVWIKYKSASSQSLVEAIHNVSFCVTLTEPFQNHNYIEGIYIKHSGNSFLSGESETDPFICSFSNELNCFIGGRGTGKSTLLKIIEFVLSQRFTSENALEFICGHGNIYILCNYDDCEYLIEFITPNKPPDENILCVFGQNRQRSFRYNYIHNKQEISQYALKNYITVFEVIHKPSPDTIDFKVVHNKKNTLNLFFDRSYSVNELVNTASGDEMSVFIYKTLFSNQSFRSLSESVSVRSFQEFQIEIKNAQARLQTRANEIMKNISPFNDTQKDVFQIKYTQNNAVESPDFSNWLNLKGNNYYEYKSKQYNIKASSIVEYLYALYYKLGLIRFFQICISRDVTEAEKSVPLISFSDPMDTDMVDGNITELDKETSELIVKHLFVSLMNNRNYRFALNIYTDYLDSIENFILEFNINSKESLQKRQPKYIDIRNLSLGQKVVAMLSFILGYGEYINDNRPLVIDQPEDNLDNQYIYKTLVKQIRNVKSKRQLIIATHSATLVTNTKAEQVIVMNSDGDRGWIDTLGYTEEKRIKKHIVNFLEGGEESFIHKMNVYRPILKDKA